MTVRFEPVSQPPRVVTVANPIRDCKAAGIIFREGEKWLQPALVLLGKVQIRKAGELIESLITRTPAITMDEKKSGGKTRAILAAGTLDEKRPRRAIEGVE